MEDLPPVDSVGKLIACQLPVHNCGALYLEFQVILEGTGASEEEQDILLIPCRFQIIYKEPPETT